MHLAAVELLLAQLLVDPVVGVAQPPGQPRPALSVHGVLLQVLYEVLSGGGNLKDIKWLFHPDSCIENDQKTLYRVHNLHVERSDLT